MGNDKTNMIIAVALSLAVLLGWNYFVSAPQVERQRQEQAAKQAQAAKDGPAASPREGGPAAPVPGTLPGAPGGNPALAATREEALARSARVRIDTPALAGSIALKGGRIDDVSLKNYHETVDNSSPRIVLLSPTGSANPYYAEFGWVSQGGAKVPDGNTEWTAEGDVLTPQKPLVLTWDNGAGLTFRRTISVDDKFMFTVADAVENKGGTAATLYPYGLVSRWGKPHTQGYYVLHEGMIGVLATRACRKSPTTSSPRTTRSARPAPAASPGPA